MLPILIVCVAAAGFFAAPASAKYEGHHVIEAFPHNQESLDVVYTFINNGQIMMDEDLPVLGRQFTFTAAPESVPLILRAFNEAHIQYDVVYTDLHSVLENEWKRIHSRSPLDDFNFDDFNTFEDIMAQLDVWLADCPAGFICTIQDYGTTYEGRPMRYIKIVADDEITRPVYWIEACIHAREWLAPATLLKMMDRIWTSYGTDPDVTHMLDNYEFYFTPIANPDGYAYTHLSDDTRLWRKNRAPTYEEDCLGTDLNRNYNTTTWGTDGVDHNCESIVYPGVGPASELETQAIQAEVTRIQQYTQLLGFWDMHTFAEYWLFPLGITEGGTENPADCLRTDTHDDMMFVGNAIADATQETHGTSWERGTICEVLYPMSGSAVDWAYSEGGVSYPYLPELRGAFFTVPPEQIQPSYEEIWNGLVAMIYAVESLQSPAA